jgi:DNA-directed RNA polymerase subunit H
MNFEDIDTIYRSRKTLLDILEKRGYNTLPYSKFSPEEISAAVPTADDFPSLGFKASKKDASDPMKCNVLYMAIISRQKLASPAFLELFEKPDSETIIMMLAPVADHHHQAALNAFLKFKTRVSFFTIFHIVNNPMDHILVPKHEIVPPDEHKAIMDHFNMTSKSKFPLIRFHIDPIVRIIGGVPGDLIKITRPSPSSGEYVFYRVVST